MKITWDEEQSRLEAQGFASLCGITLETLTDGYCRLGCQMEEHHLNPGGIAHGGAIFAMMDTAAGTAGLTLCSKDQGVVTQCADVHFLRPVGLGYVYTEAKVLKAGRKTALVTADVLDENQVLHAHGEFELFFIPEPSQGRQTE